MPQKLIRATVPVFNWKALNDTVATLCESINRNLPIEGRGILIEDLGGEGCMISVADQGKQPSGGGGGGAQSDHQPDLITPDGETAAWHQVDVVDANCNHLKMWVWGGTPK